MTNPVNNSLFLRPTDTDEVTKEINQLKNKATLDFRVPLLKHVKQELADGLVIIINKSFQEGCFPELLKIAKVIPIHKGEERTDPTNHRPIFSVSIFDKIPEKIMLNRLLNFLSKNDILYKYQFGFRKNHATTHALTEVIDCIYKSLDEGNYVLGIYIDLKKAFDTVQHHILLQKLEHYGIRRVVSDWFDSYLSKRKQLVVTNDIQSDILELSGYGVPQGSMIGPILFLFFVNDIHNSLDNIIIKLSADDTNCFISDNDFNSLERLAEIELNKLQKWANANKLTINFDPKKSSCCIFKPKNKPFLINFNRGPTMGTNVLKYKENTRYLGLILDHKLTWETHIKELNTKLVQYADIFSKIRHCLPVPCRHTVYNAVISSRLNYGSEIYTNTTRKFIQPLIVTQDKILRILQFKNIRTPLNTLYREFGVLKLNDLHHFNIRCIVHKSIHSPHLPPVAINEIFCLNEQIHDYNTRNKKDLYPIKIKKKIGRETIEEIAGTTCPITSRK